MKHVTAITTDVNYTKTFMEFSNVYPGMHIHQHPESEAVDINHLTNTGLHARATHATVTIKPMCNVEDMSGYIVVSIPDLEHVGGEDFFGEWIPDDQRWKPQRFSRLGSQLTINNYKHTQFFPISSTINFTLYPPQDEYFDFDGKSKVLGSVHGLYFADYHQQILDKSFVWHGHNRGRRADYLPDWSYGVQPSLLVGVIATGGNPLTNRVDVQIDTFFEISYSGVTQFNTHTRPPNIPRPFKQSPPGVREAVGNWKIPFLFGEDFTQDLKLPVPSYTPNTVTNPYKETMEAAAGLDSDEDA